jgi:hypothetical protein
MDIIAVVCTIPTSTKMGAPVAIVVICENTISNAYQQKMNVTMNTAGRRDPPVHAMIRDPTNAPLA